MKPSEVSWLVRSGMVSLEDVEVRDGSEYEEDVAFAAGTVAALATV